MRLNINNKFNKIEGNKDYWIIISLGRLYYCNVNECTLREIYIANIEDPNIKISSIPNNLIQVFKNIEGHTADYHPGLIFNKRGTYLSRLSDTRKRRLVAKKIRVSPSNNYFKNGINFFLKDTEFPQSIVHRNEILGYNPPYYIGDDELSDSIVYIDVSLIMRQVYPYNSILCGYLLSRQTSELIADYSTVIDLHSIFVEDEILLPYYRSLLKFCFTNSKVSGFKQLIICFNEFYVSLLNVRKNGSSNPTSLNCRFPFDIDLNISVIGEYITDKKFIAYKIQNISPLHRRDKLFKANHVYIFKKPQIKKEIKGAINYNSKDLFKKVDLARNECRLDDTPLIHYKEKDNIYYKAFQKIIFRKDRKIDKSNNQFITVDNICKKYFDKNLTFYKKLAYNPTFLKSNNPNGVHHLTITVARYQKYLVRLLFNILVVEFNKYRLQFFLIDIGPQFNIVLIMNAYERINEFDNTRLKSFLQFVESKHHFNWAKLYNDDKSSDSLITKENTDYIIKRYGFVVIDPLFLKKGQSFISKIKKILDFIESK